MSTRATIATVEGDGWRGVYSHSDGYPSYLGKNIFKTIREKFLDNEGNPGVKNRKDPKNSIKAFVDIYIKGHNGGWSFFPEVCYCHDEAFVMRDGVRDGTITSADPDPLFIEWVYVIDPDTTSMRIYKSTTKSVSAPVKDKVTKKGDAWDYGHCLAKHVFVDEVNLTGDEPNWDEIENRKVAGEYE